MKMIMTVYYLVTPMKDQKTVCRMLAGPYSTWDDADYVNELHYKGRATIAQHTLEVEA